MHGEAHGVSEVSVERHSRRQSDGIVGIESHHQRGDGSGNARGKDHAFCRHARLRQDLRVDHNNVGHGHKRGEAPEHLLPQRTLILGELEIAIDQSFPLNLNFNEIRTRDQ